MSRIFDGFRVFDDLPQIIVKDIQCLFVPSNELYCNSSYCVTKEDKVYGVGQDLTAYTQSKDKIKYILINELCDKCIEEFFDGPEYMFARNDQNEIYAWGTNKQGILLIDEHIDEYLKPQKIMFFEAKNIIQISCGYNHCLALSSEGVVYEWGRNSYDQISLYTRVDHILLPVIIELNDEITNNIRSVQCYLFDSFLVTNSGLIYEITENKCQILCDTKEKLRELEETEANQTTSLTENIDSNQVIEIIYEFSIIVFQTQTSVYECDYNDCKPTVKTDYNNLFEYYLFKLQSTYKTIHLKDNQLFAFHFIKSAQMTTKCFLLKTLIRVDTNINRFYANFEQNKKFSFKLKDFKILNDLSDNLVSDVKYYYFSGRLDTPGFFCFFVMSDSNVLGLGDNKYGKLGLGQNENKQNDYTLIQELCGHNIEEFFEGEFCIFARNYKNQIFGWGLNNCGLLGRGYQSDPRRNLKPEIINYFDNKNIINISSSNENCLALSSHGVIYGWGYNYQEQIGDSLQRFFPYPTIINLDIGVDYPFRFLQLSDYISFEVSFFTFKEKYDFLEVNKQDDILSKIQSLNSKKVIYLTNFYFILSVDGFVHKIDIKENTIKSIESDVRFVDIYCKKSLIALQSDECVYDLNIDNENDLVSLVKTNFFNFYDYFLHKHKMLFKTIYISSDGFLMTKEIKINDKYKSGENEKLFISRNENIFENKYETLFQHIRHIEKGGFGEVYEVKNKLDNLPFAIKQIKLKGNLSGPIKEVKILTEMNSEFVTKYTSSWIEAKFDQAERQFVNYAYVQMELCSQNLREVIQSMDRISDERFITFKYWISCELFRELTECVNYLHSLDIIHRDLKPENVLISDGINGRFLKLCDFGLAKDLEIFAEPMDIHSNDYKANDIIHTQGVGSHYYMSPESKKTTTYNLKSDIYSLALIATEIFRFEDGVKKLRARKNLSKYQTRYLGTGLENQFKKLLNVLSICLLSIDFNQRPDCKELLDGMSEWTLDYNTVLNNENIIEFRLTLEEPENMFWKMFVDTKLTRVFKE